MALRFASLSHRLLFACAGVAILLSGCGQSSRSAVSTPAPTLTVHAKTTHFTARLTGGYQVTGTLYPTLPQFPNTLRMRLVTLSRQSAHPPQIRLVLTMLDMKMPTVSAVANRHGVDYSGHITPRMFGSYRAELSARDSAGFHQGTFNLKLNF